MTYPNPTEISSSGHVIGDVVSGGAVLLAIYGHLAAVLGFVPYLAGFAGLIWYCLQIWDWWQRRGERKLAQLVARDALDERGEKK
jgi:hypothetical protein